MKQGGKDGTGRGGSGKSGREVPACSVSCLTGELLQLIVYFRELFEGVAGEVLSYFLKYSKGLGICSCFLQDVETGGYVFAQDFIKDLINYFVDASFDCEKLYENIGCASTLAEHFYDANYMALQVLQAFQEGCIWLFF